MLQKYPLGYLQSAFSPSIFLRGQGLMDYFNLLISAPSDYYRNNELIINAYNTTLGQTEIFSTVSSSKSQLKNKSGPLLLLGVACQVDFLGDLPDPEYKCRLLQVLMATSSVPIIFTPVSIDNNRYVDGGVSFSSPLTAISCLMNFTDVLYINPSDIDVTTPVSYGDVITNAVGFVSQIARSNALQDRYMYLQVICCGAFNRLLVESGEVDISVPVTVTKFNEKLVATANASRMVEIFPATQTSSGSMSENQSKQEYISQIVDNLNRFKYRIFFVE